MELFEPIVAEEGQVFLGWRPLKTDNSTLGDGAAAVEPTMFHALVGRGPTDRRRRRLRAQALRHPQAVRDGDRGLGARRPQVLLLLQPLVPDPRLQGDAHPRAGRRLLRRRPGRPAAGQRPLHVPLAVQHQHLPELGAGPPLPDDLAQRRDQHPARQHQLDAGPRGPLRLRPVRAGRRRRSSCRSSARGCQRHRLPRQRGRAAGQVGLQPAPRDDDADPRGVGKPRDDVPGQEGLLRLPHLPDGALGRPGVDRLHRRQEHRRGARPQRPAAQPLRRHQGRPGHHGLRGRRARHPARGRRPEGPARAGQDVPGRPGAGPDRRRRGAEAPDRLGQALRQVAPRVHGPAGRPARGARTSPAPTTRRCCTASRRSATRSRTSSTSSARWATTARRRSARWGPTPRWPSSPTAPSRCSTTSSSSSPR